MITPKQAEPKGSVTLDWKLPIGDLFRMAFIHYTISAQRKLVSQEHPGIPNNLYQISQARHGIVRVRSKSRCYFIHVAVGKSDIGFSSVPNSQRVRTAGSKWCRNPTAITNRLDARDRI